MNQISLSCVVSAALLVISHAASAGSPAGHGGGTPMGMPAGAMSSTGRAATAWTAPFHDSHATTASTNAAHANPQTVLEQNPRLDAQLQKLLPSGSTPQQACAGFSELGGCISALHVANNLKIPFDELKARVTGNDPSSLGAAIHALRPDTGAEQAQHQAEIQTRHDLAATTD